MSNKHRPRDAEQSEDQSVQSPQERITKLEKRIRRGRVGAFIGVVAAAGTLIGLHELDKKPYVPYDSAQEIALIAHLENQDKTKDFQVFEGSVLFQPGAKIYETPQDSTNLFEAQEYDKVQPNVVDPKIVFKGLHSPNSTGDYKPVDTISIYYPVVVKQKTDTLDFNSKQNKVWYGFKELVNGDYHFYWMNADDAINKEPNSDSHKGGLVAYDDEHPLGLLGQADYLSP